MQSHAEARHTFTADTIEARYQRAQYIVQGIGTQKLVCNDNIYPFWIRDSDCFWYMKTTKLGKGELSRLGCEYRLVNAQAKTNQLAFCHKTLAAALTERVRQEVDSRNLPISNVEMDFGLYSCEQKTIKKIKFTAFQESWEFDTDAAVCEKVNAVPEHWEVSPDGINAVFVRNSNLWLRELSTGNERPLTNDGDENFSYGYSGSGWGFVAEPSIQVRWSPDSRYIFAVQHDSRQVRSLPVIDHVPKDGGLRPSVKQIKMAYPGDAHIPTLRLLSIDIDTGRLQDANYRQIPVTRNCLGFFASNLGWWGD
jgi:hypothetical protein